MPAGEGPTAKLWFPSPHGRETATLSVLSGGGNIRSREERAQGFRSPKPIRNVELAFIAFNAILVVMRGRPKRQVDEELAGEIERACLQHRVSLSAFALEIGTTASTLHRSLKAKAFSRSLADRLREGLNKKAAEKVRREPGTHEDPTKEFLRLLQKLVELAPDVSAAVKIALDPSRSKD